MQKPARSVEGTGGRCDSGSKPWPVANHDAAGETNPVRTHSLHARFNPRLVGFGIVGPALDGPECNKDRSQGPQALDGTCDQDSEERK